jgi:hypothetical protein
MIVVELISKVKSNARHWYAYDVLLNGELIVSSSRDPEHDLAQRDCSMHSGQEDQAMGEHRSDTRARRVAFD